LKYAAATRRDFRRVLRRLLGQAFGVSEMLCFVRQLAVWAVWGFFCVVSAPVSADHPLAFPWGTGDHPSTPLPAASAPYQILHAANGRSQPQVTLQQMSPKVGYAYGWFGSNPTRQVSRHVGFHQNYTQWKLTP